MKKIDYIVVGQGLAGSVLASTLMQEDQKVLVVDKEELSNSSKIAAGICNPVVFKKLTKSWMVDEVLPFAKKFYRNQEQLLKSKFYFDIPIYKLFADESEQTFWKRKSNEAILFDLIDDKIEHPFDTKQISYDYGAAKVKQSGYLKTLEWLNSFRSYLKSKDAYIDQKFDYSEVDFDSECVNWKEYQAKKIIFCEGYKCIHNPYFNWLSFKLTKGEILTINVEGLELKETINKGVFVLPFGKNYKLGATYNWSELDENTTENGKNQLIEKASKFIHSKINVIDHKAGVRPTVSDRRPLLGIHPDYPQLAVFNGMGTKGVMLAPYFAKKMSDFLLKEHQLPQEVNIMRFFKSN